MASGQSASMVGEMACELTSRAMAASVSASFAAMAIVQMPAGVHFAEYQPHGVDVGRLRLPLALQDLRRDPCGCTHAASHGVAVDCDLSTRAKVDELGLVVTTQQDVLSLEIAVHDRLRERVQVHQCLCDINREGDLGAGHRAAVESSEQPGVVGRLALLSQG